MTKTTRSSGKRALPLDDALEQAQSSAKKTHLQSPITTDSPGSPLTSDEDDSDTDAHTAPPNGNPATATSKTAGETSVNIDNTDHTTRTSSESAVTPPPDVQSGNETALDDWRSHCNAKWTSTLRRRIPYFLHYADKKTHRYSPAALPTLNTSWVCKDQSRSNNQTLCVHNGAPLILWITGEVMRALFIYAGGDYRMRASVQINPIRDGDLQKVTTFLRDLASITKSDADEDNGLWASRYQGHRYRGDQKATAVEFTTCFDGRTEFGARAEMQRYPISCINDNDLVMVECTITRFKCDASGDAVYTGGWKHWRTQLQILTLTKLSEGPERAIQEDIGLSDDVHI